MNQKHYKLLADWGTPQPSLDLLDERTRLERGRPPFAIQMFSRRRRGCWPAWLAR